MTIGATGALALQGQTPPESELVSTKMNSWMHAQDFRPWGMGQDFDELLQQAADEEKRKEKELKAAAGAQQAEMAIAHEHQSEMEVDGNSELEGFAEPLNETEINEMADSWASINNTDVTFTYSTHCDPRHGCRSSGHKKSQPSFQEMHRNVLASLRALRFCFSDILIILDTPHVGHDKLGPETPGNVTSHVISPHADAGFGSEMALIGGRQTTKYTVDANLKSGAISTAKAAAELLRDHCATAAPQWRVKIVDYASEEMRKQALSHYAIPSAENKTNFYERMYINTMALDQNFQAKSQYVYHMDAQWRIYRSNHSRSLPNFISKGVSLMQSDPRVYMASVINTFNLEPQRNPYNRFAVIPGAVHGSQPVERVKGMLQGWNPEAWLSQKRPLRGEAFHGNWENKTDEMNKKIALFKMNWDKWGGIVTRHQFLMDVTRFKGLFPLEEWDTAAEHMWSANMNKKFPEKAFQIYFNETVGVFAGPSDA